MRDGRIRVASHRHNAFTHHMGLVSLFDFGPTAVDEVDGFGIAASDHMYGWLNGTWPDRSPMAVWLEADVDRMSTKYRNAAELSPLAGRMKFIPKTSTRTPRRALFAKFIHGLEAGHQGPLPVGMLNGAVLVECSTSKVLYRGRVDEDLVRRVRVLNGSSWETWQNEP